MQTMFETIQVTSWPDPLLERIGVAVDSTYVRRCWTSVLGPTATLALVELAELAQVFGTVSVDTDDLAAQLGVKTPALARALGRLQRFGVARLVGGRFQVRTHLGPVAERLVARMSVAGRQLHEALVPPAA